MLDICKKVKERQNKAALSKENFKPTEHRIDEIFGQTQLLSTRQWTKRKYAQGTIERKFCACTGQLVLCG
jgi:hypothetical protein